MINAAGRRRSTARTSFASVSHSTAARRMSKRRVSLRNSLPANDSDLHILPTKCPCSHCPFHSMTDAYLAERDRIYRNEGKVMRAIDNQVEELINELEQLVQFQTVSADPSQLLECSRALDWMADRLSELNFRTYEHKMPDDPQDCFSVHPQKVIFARYFSSPSKSTVLIYGHLDVVPVKRDCWLHDPFRLELKDGLVYGRGVTSGKGMIVGWLQAIETWLSIHDDLPVNIKFIVDTLHEVGSTGLQDYIKEKTEFFLDVDYMLFDVNSWLTKERPVVACSITGWAHFSIEARGANKDLESGLATGLVYEPMVDLCHIMNGLLTDDQEIMIPHMDVNLKRLSIVEWQLLEAAEFEMYEYKENLYVRRLKYEANKVGLLQSRWCKPTLTMHGVHGADTRPGCRRVLPMKVTGMFSLRLVPDQDLQQIFRIVGDYLEALKKDLKPNTRVSMQLTDGMDPVAWSPNSKYMKAINRAIYRAYLADPVFTQAIPICMPVANILYKLIDKPIILLPFYKRSDRHRLENESIEELALVRHTKACAAVLYELSLLRPKCKCNVIHDYCNQRGVQEHLDESRINLSPIRQKKTLNILKTKADTHIEKDIPKTPSKVNSIRKWLCWPTGRPKKFM